MVIFLWAINGHLLLDPTLVWWSNDVLINHTELTIEMCLTVWNWCIRVSDGTRVVLSESYAIGVVTAQELCFLNTFWNSVNRLTQYEIIFFNFSNSINRLTHLVNRLTQDGKQFSKRFSNSVNRLTHLVNRLTQGRKQFLNKFQTVLTG